jgi:hypothetical protein
LPASRTLASACNSYRVSYYGAARHVARRETKETAVTERSDIEHPPQFGEPEATRLAQEAVDLAGGAQMIYRNPRQPFSQNSRKVFEIDGCSIEVRWGEISSPAIVTAGGYVFEIHDEGIELLVRPPRPRKQE